jgi:hypothetical protein
LVVENLFGLIQEELRGSLGNGLWREKIKRREE